ncbi:MAG: hypothetical protein WED34_22080 [Planctomycetales bacterium]
MNDHDRAKLDPAALAIPDAAAVLSKASGRGVTEEMLRTDLDAGAPTNADGTLNLMHYAPGWRRRCPPPAAPAAGQRSECSPPSSNGPATTHRRNPTAGRPVCGGRLLRSNSRCLTAFGKKRAAGANDEPLEWSATGGIHSGKMVLEYAFRGASSFQLHTYFQLSTAEYTAAACELLTL